MTSHDELRPEKAAKYSIEAPRPGDDVLIGKMHLQSWHETYRDDDAGITPDIIDALRGGITSEESNAIRRSIFADATVEPNRVLYKVVRRGDEVVGFLHGVRHEDANELDAIYILDEAKGSGIGAQLMDIFLAWSDKTKPTYLDVFSSNARAQAFYERYGFTKSDAPEQLYKEKMPFIRMTRPAENAAT